MKNDSRICHQEMDGNNGFITELLALEMIISTETITGRNGETMKVEYFPETKGVKERG